MPDLLISPVELSAKLTAGDPVRVLDVRWRLDRPDGRADHAAGHLPGAVYVDLDTELAGPPSPEAGRHPLPDPASLQDAARRWGTRQGDLVVVYDDLSSMSAARAWWLLTDAGLDVRILDGALAGWVAAGLPLDTGAVVPEPGDVVLRPGGLPILSIDEAAAMAASGLLLDVRAPERYRGEVEPIDPRAGHIPGAVNLPTAGNVNSAGRFRDAAELRDRALAAGAEPGGVVGVSCGSGVTAAHAAIALTLAGFRPVLYPGSWSQWSSDPHRPIATGPEPDGA